MRFGNKGQGSFEYLMTYGWAILVVMIAGVALWQIGVFGSNPGMMSVTGFAKIKPQLSGIGLDNRGYFTGVFTNTVGTPIRLNNFMVHNTMKATQCEDTNSQWISGGDNFVVSITGCGEGRVNDLYELNIILDYDVTVGGKTTSHKEVGTIRGAYE